MSRKALENALDGLFADRAYYISAKTIRVYGGSDDRIISDWLRELELSGKIRILKELSESEETDRCIELKSFIGK